MQRFNKAPALLLGKSHAAPSRRLATARCFNEAPALLPGKSSMAACVAKPAHGFNEAPALLPGKSSWSIESTGGTRLLQ